MYMEIMVYIGSILCMASGIRWGPETYALQITGQDILAET